MIGQDDYAFFKENVESNYMKLIKFIVYVTGDEHLAYDITQDTMADAWKYRDRIKTYTNIEAALITMAKNNLKKHFKKYPMLLPIEELSHVASDDKKAEDIVIEAETGEELKKVLKSLDKKYSQILILHHYYKLPLKEIAKIYGKNYNTVLSWHVRAVKKLKEKRRS